MTDKKVFEMTLEDFESRDEYLNAQVECFDSLILSCEFELNDEDDEFDLSEAQKAKINVRKSLLSSLVSLLQNEENTDNNLDGLSFGMAILLMEQGFKLARKGWNGKGMYLFLTSNIEFTTNADLSQLQDTPVHKLNSLVMKTADNNFVVGWLASQTDMLAKDWQLVK